jgi:hypothetical protein
VVGVRQVDSQYRLLSLDRVGHAQPLATVVLTVWPELSEGASQETINRLNHALLAFGVAIERIYYQSRAAPGHDRPHDERQRNARDTE